jgi:hypothetical protein
MKVPCVALVGAFGEEFEETLEELELQAHAIAPAGMTAEESLARAPELLATAAANVVSACSG